MPSARTHKLPPAWLFIIVVLSTAPELRIADVQILEAVQLLRVLLMLLVFAHMGLKVPQSTAWRRDGSGYLSFLFFTLLLSIAALRLPFYPPSDISFIKLPFVLSLSRLLELSLAIYFMLAISDTLLESPRLLRVALDIYTGAGAITALAGIIAFAAFRITGEDTLLINDLDHRVSGLFNEGGPYGLFLTSVILLFLMRRRVCPYAHPFIARTGLLIVFTAWVLSFSKAGVLTGILCCATMAACLRDVRKRLVAAALLPVACAGFVVMYQHGLDGYIDNISYFDEAVLFRPHDRNLVMGRIVGFFVIPRMIAAHPLLGIGLGNYSLMRNDPDYLQGLPAVDDWDLPGLGLVSDAAELGIPLTLALILLILRPLWRAKRMKAHPIVIAAAAFQPVALLMGVNLNFFYPWLVSAFVLASLGQSSGPRAPVAVSEASPFALRGR